MENLDNVEELEIYNTKAKLEAIHQDIKRLMERSNQEYLDLILTNFKKDILNSISSYFADDIKKV